MKGIYVITIAFLALWTDNEITAKEDQPEQSIWKEGFNGPKPIPTKCPPWEKFASNIAHETDCTKFYKCNFGKGVPQDCPLMIPGDKVTRLHFNRREQVCDWPEMAGCIYCPPRDRNGNWPRSKISHETDNCGKYYECINGDKRLRSCPAGTCFSRTCQECVKNRAGGNCDLPPPLRCEEKKEVARQCPCTYKCRNNRWDKISCGENPPPYQSQD